ncbi:carrier protein [Cryptosporidium andersoni]|uniref:Carrier protein n=1 Tax=Cryptosporidium andersoni TaxID=117008 RepID=A0A1J4MFR6_9CRYT|nr:carrier protein [Cryptosporidium andersoni]
MDDNVLIENDNICLRGNYNYNKKLKNLLVNSLIAGFIGRLISHPLDTLKTRKQSNLYKYKLGYNQNKQYKNLYSGLTISLLGGIPATALYFCSYEYFKNKLHTYTNHNITNFCSGFLAEVFSSILWVPIDVIRERLQIKNITLQSNIITNNINNKYRLINIMSNLYKGYFPTIISFGSFSALYFLFYGILKKYINDENIYKVGIISTISGFGASGITAPLDLIKVRLQIDNKDIPLYDYKNMKEGIYKIIKKSGFQSIFSGALYRMIFHAQMTSITIILIQFLQRYQNIKGLEI